VKPSEKVREHWREKRLPGDPFNLHAVLFLGTCKGGHWKVGSKSYDGEVTHDFWAEHGVGIDEETFDREHEDWEALGEDVVDAFLEELSETMKEKLL
jgi:hypothetical protein